MSATELIDNPYSVTALEAGDAIFSAAKSLFVGVLYLPIMLWGDSGVGKTQSIVEAARRLKANLFTIHAVDREPTEIVGINWVVNGEMKRLAPGDIPFNDEPNILFFDEVPQAPMMNKNVIARVVHERMVGNNPLGKRTYVCCAGNYAHNRAGTTPMPAHLNLRMSHLDVVVSYEQWLLWAATHGVHPYVSGYIRLQPDRIHKPDPSLRASPNPRSWHRVGEIEFTGMTGQARKSMIVGTLGMDAGTAYLDRTDMLKDMPDPHEVLKDPARAEVPKDRGTLFVLCSALGKIAKPANMDSLIKYTNRFTDDEEYQVLTITEAKLRNPAVTSAKAYRDFLLTQRGQSITA
jgi:hypothetical protein